MLFICRKIDIKLVKLDLDVDLEEQGPFHILLHKLTDHYGKSKEGHEVAIRQIENFKVSIVCYNR